MGNLKKTSNLKMVLTEEEFQDVNVKFIFYLRGYINEKKCFFEKNSFLYSDNNNFDNALTVMVVLYPYPQRVYE